MIAADDARIWGMQTFKSVLRVFGALLPILYCGGLIYYFLDLSGSVREAEAIGLGPTLIGLTVVGLLFCIPLIVKIVRIFIEPRSPGSSGGSGRAASTHDGKDGFDPDAAVARYMAQRSAETAPGTPPAPPTHESGPATRPSFGRKVK
jgi:hypothetical protein